MFFIFSQYITKRPIKLETTLVRFVQDIYSGLIRPSTFDEITECMVEPEANDEVVDLTLPSSHLCLIYVYVVDLHSKILCRCY
jgi:hypothetical protein